MESLLVVKIGGNIIDDDEKLSLFLQEFASIPGKKLLVHGGGKLATKLADQLGIQQELLEGRRITDSETLRIVTMVYAGYINKNIVAALQALNIQAIGITGVDGNSIRAHKRIHPTVDYGFVGDIDHINDSFLTSLLDQGLSVVMAPITHDGKGQVLNTNADTIAQEVAKALSKKYSVRLVYSFEKNGVLQNVEDDNSVIKEINPASYEKLKDSRAIFAGMIPKLDNAFVALRSGVKKVIIGKAEELKKLIEGHAGTTIIDE
jgi:acetylglutamate kinase